MEPLIVEPSMPLTVDGRGDEAQVKPEPQVDAAVGSLIDDATKSKKKKKKKKKNRRKSVEAEHQGLQRDIVEPDEEGVEPSVDVSRHHEVAVPRDELTSLTLERTSSLDALKATGTKAVGSLFSRLKVGLKKPQPSPTEAVVTAVAKQGDVPDGSKLDETSVLLEEEWGKKEQQSVGVTFEADATSADEAASAALVSTMDANAATEAPSEASEEKVEALASVEVEVEETAIETAKAGSIGESGDFTEGGDLSMAVDVDQKVTTNRTVTTSVSVSKRTSKVECGTVLQQDDQEVSESQCVMPNFEPLSDTTIASSAEIGSLTECAESEAVESTRNTEIEAIVSERVESELVSSTETAENEAVLIERAENEAAVRTESAEVEALSSTEGAKLETVSLTESADSEHVPSRESTQDEAAPSTDCSLKETVLLTESTPHEAILSIESAQDEALSSTASGQEGTVSINSSELLSVAVVSSTEELSAASAPRVEPKKSSPVKKLASRFEGKREQSLDSLKFRTVREFFPTERSIRVGAEKEKYEAQAQQQQLKAKSEDEAKTKYKVESFDEMRTPDAASLRETMSVDEVPMPSQSPSKFSDEAPTPVKSIASRFEGKGEQSLDNLKFRTVREFFPNEDQRSICVGAEKAKFEALRKQHEGAADSVQLKGKHATSSPEKKGSAELLACVDASAEASSLTLDEVQDETTSSGVAKTGVVKKENVLLREKTVASEAERDESVAAINDSDAVAFVKKEEAESFTRQADKVAASSEEKKRGETNEVKHVDVNGCENTEIDSLTTNESEDIVDQQRHEADGSISKEPDSGDQTSAEVEQADEKDGVGLYDVPVVETVTRDQVVLSENNGDTSQERGEVDEEQQIETSEVAQVDLDDQVVIEHPVESPVITTDGAASLSIEVNDCDNEQLREVQEAVKTEIELIGTSADDGLVAMDQHEPVAEPPTSSNGDITSRRSMLTTERSFVIDKDNTIETEDTVVVGERPMTDGEDEFDPVPSARLRPAHEIYADSTLSRSTRPEPEKKKATAVTVPKQCVSSSAQGASTVARKVRAPLKNESSASKNIKSTVGKTRPQQSMVKHTGSKSATGFVNAAPPAPTAASTASSQARNTVKAAKPKLSTTVVKPKPTVFTAPKRASIVAPTASFKAKKTTEAAKEVPSASPVRRSRQFASVKSRVLDGIQSGLNHIVSHKTITKEDFIAAERRKSLGSANVRSVFETVNRRASLTARTSISGSPHQFIRSATSRKKLDSTAPRYMNYENTRSYAERAQVQYERRKRLEEANALKSEKRQRELHLFFTEQQHKALLASADEVRRGLEAHEFIQSAKEAERRAQKMARKPHQRSVQQLPRTSSATSSAGASSNGLTSRTSKRSSISSVSVEEKGVPVQVVDTVTRELGTETAPVTVATESVALEDGRSVLANEDIVRNE